MEEGQALENVDKGVKKPIFLHKLSPNATVVL